MLDDMVGVVPLEDVVGWTWGHPHFRIAHADKSSTNFEVAVNGVVYCADCASQIGTCIDAAGLKGGGTGEQSRWLQAENIRAAWMSAIKEK